MNNFHARPVRFSNLEKIILNKLILDYGDEYGQRYLADMIVRVSAVFNNAQQNVIRSTALNNRTWSSIYGRLRRQWAAALLSDRMPSAV